MLDSQTQVAEHQTLAIILLAKETVVATIPMLGISDNRMKDVRHMAAKLVFATRMRLQSYQAVPTGRMLGRDCIGELDRLQPLQLGLCLLGWFIHSGIFIGDLVELFLERVVDEQLLRCPAPHQGQILFLDPVLGKVFTQDASRLRIQSK